MSRCKLRTPWPIHFKLRIVIGIDSLMVCILFGEITMFSGFRGEDFLEINPLETRIVCGGHVC
jgi:hypothetical protein